MRKVSPLVGYKSLRAFNAFNALLLGLKMLPIYQKEDYETFYQAFEEKTDDEKEKFLRQAVAFVQLEEEEVAAIICFCHDANGVQYGSTNAKNLSLDELNECIVSVCMEIGRIKISLVSENEKKNFSTSQST